MMVATTCFWVFKIRPSNSASTLMVTTSYDKAVPARTAFFVFIPPTLFKEKNQTTIFI